MDEKFDQMLARGMSEEDILRQVTSGIDGNTVRQANDSDNEEEVPIDFDQLNLDPEIKAQFEQFMANKSQDPDVQAHFQKIDSQMQEQAMK